MGRIHGVTILDDDWATAGTNLAAADFIDGESTVIKRDGDAGVLVDIALFVQDVVAASTGCKSRLELQPTDWTSPQRIVHPVDTAQLVITDSAAATQALPKTPRIMVVTNRYGTHPRAKLTNGMSWVNAGLSRLFATTASEEAAAILYIWYAGAKGVDPIIDKNTGLPFVDVLVPVKAADGDNAAEDVYEQYISEVLNDETPGIYTDHEYAIVMIGSEPQAAGDNVGMTLKVAPKGQENYWLVATGHGTNLSPCLTYFTFGVPAMSGTDVIIVQGTQMTVHTPNIYIGLQDITARGLRPMGVSGAGMSVPTVIQNMKKATEGSIRDASRPSILGGR